jgi:hypothetical protein
MPSLGCLSHHQSMQLLEDGTFFAEIPFVDAER